MRLYQYCAVICLGWMWITQGAMAQVSTGTGFSVAPGFVITNQHVIDGCTSVEIKSGSGRHRSAVVDADPLIDLALLRAPTLVGTSAKVRNPTGVVLGEPVMVFGFPLAGSLTSGGNFTSGLVSGLRGLRESAGEFQITAPVQPGNSGGPVLDASGQVIGVVVAKLDAVRAAVTTGDIPQNINFAVTSEVLNAFLLKNKVSLDGSGVTKLLDTASIAKLAQSFTHQIECMGKAQQAKDNPQVGNPSFSKTFKDCPDCPEMVVIPAGAFMMGSKPDPFALIQPPSNAQPQRSVSIRSFSIGKFEVTQEQWYALMGTLPSNFKGRTLPVEQISWTDAQEFVQKLSQKTGKQYRLPTEAEWEYAARAGSQTAYYFGDNVSQLGRYALFGENSARQTQPVGGKLPNIFGLHDIHGNVWEWTQDCWNENFVGAPTDGSAWTSGDCSQRVLRGGSWNSDTYFLRSAYRFKLTATDRGISSVGFRVARAP
jgi:formylglycine-generating enzyme required for sulfatase activity